MRCIFFILLTSCSLAMAAQSVFIGHTIVNLADPQRENREISLEVYYPAKTSGENAPVIHPGTKKYPVVCFAHGYLMKPKDYSYIYEILVPEGFMIVMPDTETGIFPSHTDYAKDLRYISMHFPLLSEDPNSFFHGCIQSTVSLIGHSMGGGCAVLAAVENPAVHALVTLAAFDTSPSAIESSQMLEIPCLIFSGSNDRITKPKNHQFPMYENLPGVQKTWINILGGSHCQMAEKNSTCKLGEILIFNRASISSDVQHFTLKKYLIPWLRFYLKADVKAGKCFDQMLMEDKEIEFRQDSKLVNFED